MFGSKSVGLISDVSLGMNLGRSVRVSDLRSILLGLVLEDMLRVSVLDFQGKWDYPWWNFLTTTATNPPLNGPF